MEDGNSTNRLIVYDRETHLELRTGIDLGDVVNVIRGNGPREGDRMGTATVTAFDDGVPVFDVRLMGGGTDG